jgi:putative holliday junction resolvase
MSLLGIDLGEKRVGVAKSDELKLLAHSMGFIRRTDDEQVIEVILKFIKEHSIGTIVIGLPKTMKGETGAQAHKAIRFSELLRKRTGCKVVNWDERLTTVQAEKALLAQDMSRAKRREKRDSASAEIMLQSYLDFLKEKKV